MSDERHVKRESMKIGESAGKTNEFTCFDNTRKLKLLYMPF
jgi:hypothetical protein